jgi:hypothetical protein
VCSPTRSAPSPAGAIRKHMNKVKVATHSATLTPERVGGGWGRGQVAQGLAEGLDLPSSARRHGPAADVHPGEPMAQLAIAVVASSLGGVPSLPE